ncbi:MAG: glycosyltransferase family 25 protein [bacterium]
MKAFVINLESAPERWVHMQQAFLGSPFQMERVAAISGKSLKLPIPEFDQERFRRSHGRGVNIYEVACYLSHIKAIRAFLKTSESHAMICEDDLHPKSDTGTLLTALMKTSFAWNIVRLTGLSGGTPWKVVSLNREYSLNVQMGRLKGCGAYILDRKAAEAFVTGLVPMWLPWDHAADREWPFGLKAVSVSPFPISQTEEKFTSDIQGNSQPRLSSVERWRTTYPYQIGNEFSRWIHRGGYALGLKLRFLCSRDL